MNDPLKKLVSAAKNAFFDDDMETLGDILDAADWDKMVAMDRETLGSWLAAVRDAGTDLREGPGVDDAIQLLDIVELGMADVWVATKEE